MYKKHSHESRRTRRKPRSFIGIIHARKTLSYCWAAYFVDMPIAGMENHCIMLSLPVRINYRTNIQSDGMSGWGRLHHKNDDLHHFLTRGAIGASRVLKFKRLSSTFWNTSSSFYAQKQLSLRWYTKLYGYRRSIWTKYLTRNLRWLDYVIAKWKFVELWELVM